MSTTLKTEGLNESAKALKIHSWEPNPISKAPRRYVITGFDASTNPDHLEGTPLDKCIMLFQNGSPAEVGVNGITPEAVVVVLKDMFEKFQTGKFACNENGRILQHLDGILDEMRNRTQNRMARFVEGTYQA